MNKLETVFAEAHLYKKTIKPADKMLNSVSCEASSETRKNKSRISDVPQPFILNGLAGRESGPS